MSPITTRRDFLTQALQGTAAGGWLLAGGSLPLGVQAPHATFAAPQEQPLVSDTALPIIDTHQHLWDLKRLRLPWVKKAGPVLDRSFLMSDYLEATRGLNVVKTVYMEVNVDPADLEREADDMLELCRRDDNPMSAAVIGAAPLSDGFEAYARKYAASEYVKGMRTVLHDPDRPQGMCLERRFVKNMQLLGELGLCFDLCMRPGELLDGAKLVEQCPHTRFVIDHCGNMSVQSEDRALRERWMQGMRALAEHERTVCKISGIVVTAKEDWQPSDLAPNIEFCLDTFGEDRVYFAGDWPVCTLRASFKAWLSALQQIVADRSPEFQRKLFYANAARFYGIG